MPIKTSIRVLNVKDVTREKQSMTQKKINFIGNEH